MSIDKRKKLLKNLRLVHYESFERLCEQLGITYTFPPEYYRRAHKRWLVKKEFCKRVKTTLFLDFYIKLMFTLFDDISLQVPRGIA